MVLEMPLRSTFSIRSEAFRLQGGGGFVEDLRVKAGIDQRAEEHVAADAGETIKISDAHELSP